MAQQYIGIIIDPCHPRLIACINRLLRQSGVQINWRIVSTGTELLRGLTTGELTGILGISPNYARQNVGQVVADLLSGTGIGDDQRRALVRGVPAFNLHVAISTRELFKQAIRLRRCSAQPRQTGEVPKQGLMQVLKSVWKDHDSGELVARAEARRRQRKIVLLARDVELAQFLSDQVSDKGLPWLLATHEVRLTGVSLERGDLAAVIDVHLDTEGQCLGIPHVLRYHTSEVIKMLIATHRLAHADRPKVAAPPSAPRHTINLDLADMQEVHVESLKSTDSGPPPVPIPVSATA